MARGTEERALKCRRLAKIAPSNGSVRVHQFATFLLWHSLWSVDCSAEPPARYWDRRTCRRSTTVDHGNDRGDSPDRRHESALHILHAYRERRRQRRGEDTYFGSVDCFIERSEAGFEQGDRERRRSELMEEAETVGMPRDLAELL